ncbi:DUF4974 domain-containing protein [Hymenobacter setariae]|jgi:ferric-dicitrate binding protein FerR (iron transport regulator)|uniref:DUF4974 domain-containing protein n=1 Tax=Hymenobacter setariae TaxID=2594794 RepID=A0A558BKN9_9BACT|nr:FecR family protein [Hymenobacter setariae]TVT37063.1 DUF4974 domain-containing protein [Hymenobacter setariae]
MSPLYADPADAPWELLARHLAAEASASERAALRAWTQADPRHLQILTTVTRAWERAGEVVATPPLFSPADVEAAWRRFQPLMAPPVPPASVAPLPVATPWLAGWWPWAAALVAAAGGGYLWLSHPSPTLPESVSTYAAAAHRQLVRLPDSSRAWLHAHSRLHYRATAAGPSERAAQLTGEAYFDVAPAAGKPFVVHTGSGRVRVGFAGAALNVRAYAAEDSVEVSVARGQAWLLPPTAGDSLLLLAGTRAALHAADAPGRVAAAPRRTPAANQNFRAWQTDTLRFEDAPVTQVARTLQATFGTAVTWSSVGLGQCRFTGTFIHPRPAQVLAVVAAATASRLLPDGRGGYQLQGLGCAAPSASDLAPAAPAPRP